MTKKKKRIIAWVIIAIIVLSIVVYFLCASSDFAQSVRSQVFTYLGLNTEEEQQKEPQTASLTGLEVVDGELAIHFMMLGNDNAGDCIYIKAGDNDILIDAGSTAGSITTIKTYVDQYVVDNTFEYVIVTHADKDHIAAFTGKTNIFSEYVCETIIDFPLTNKTTEIYGKYVTNRDKEVEDGATHFTALECYKESKEGAQKIYQLSSTISLEILYNYYYENYHEDENNYSVCVNIKHGTRNFLLTGDLEQEGEEHLVQDNVLGEAVFFKAGHHGSKTSSNDVLLDIIKPQICVVPCVAGTDEYTKTVENQFPTQAFINRISKHTQRVFVPSQVAVGENGEESFKPMNGNIIIKSYQSNLDVVCSENSTFLKDTEWFKGARTCPEPWQNIKAA